jgi:hypothetical protein
MIVKSIEFRNRGLKKSGGFSHYRKKSTMEGKKAIREDEEDDGYGGYSRWKL